MLLPRALAHHAPRTWLAIAAAGAAGSLLRYAITNGGSWGAVLAANILGCAVLGALVGRRRASPALGAGFCGGLTTFSGVAAGAALAARGDAHGSLALFGVPALAAVLILAFNAVAGLVAFLAARSLSDAGQPAPPAFTESA